MTVRKVVNDGRGMRDGWTYIFPYFLEHCASVSASWGYLFHARVLGNARMLLSLCKGMDEEGAGMLLRAESQRGG